MRSSLLCLGTVLVNLIALSQADFASSTDCCNSLSKIGLNITLPVTVNDTAPLYWSERASSLIPQCIVSPQSIENVSAAVKILVDENCLFAVRGGGHTPWANASSIGSNGLLISFGDMRNVIYEGSTVRIGPGAKWGDVYGVLDLHNMTVPGGRASGVGVAGLTTGGGNSFLAAQKGFVCDNVQNFTVVLENGTIVNANKDDNSDLHRALKGGSNNFGIVVEFEMFAVKQNLFWGGTVSYDIPINSEKNIEYIVDFTNNVHNEPNGSLISIWIWKSPLTGANPFLYNIYDYLGPYNETANPATDFPEPFSNFSLLSAAPQTSTLRVNNMSNFTGELNLPYAGRYAFATLTFNNSVTDIQAAKDVVEKNYNRTNGGNDATYNFTGFSMQIQPLPSVFWNNSQNNGGNVLGLERNSQNLILFLLELQWDEAQYDAAMNTLAENIINEIKGAIGSNTNDYVYLNYALPSQDPIGGYGLENTVFLANVSKRYDPNGVFQNNLPGGFKLLQHSGISIHSS